MIRVQREDFDIGAELERLSAGDHSIGGVASFVGLVRDVLGHGGGPQQVSALTLEHYPGMTEKKLFEIEAEANRRWPLAASLIIAKLFSAHLPGVTTIATALFIVLWLAITALNMWLGVAKAGYSIAEELPIQALIFGLPAAAALLVRWKWL